MFIRSERNSADFFLVISLVRARDSRTAFPGPFSTSCCIVDGSLDALQLVYLSRRHSREQIQGQIPLTYELLVHRSL